MPGEGAGEAVSARKTAGILANPREYSGALPLAQIVD
jgi:hypothetical protein